MKITPFLVYVDDAEAAMNHYLSIFEDAQVIEVERLGDGGPDQTVVVCTFELQGQRFRALSGGPEFKFSPAVSFQIDCEGQDEVDRLWNGLIAGGGEPSRCGWLLDKYGVSWQVIPSALGECLSDPDPARAKRSLEAMNKMTKIEIAQLESAREGTGKVEGIG